MNPFDQLNSYMRRLERRLRWMTVSRGAAVLALLALAATLGLVLITNAFAFSPTSLLWARVVLFLALALALGLGLVGPILQISRRRTARRAEQTYPEFQERLLTVVERSAVDPTNPFLALVASDAASIAEQTQPERLAPRRKMLGLFASAGAAAAVLLWLILAGPGYFGYGAALLWGGTPKIGFQPYYDILVRPGNHTVRKRADQLVTAQPVGFQPAKVRIFARYGAALKWEEAAMQPQPEGSGYAFLFAGLADSVQYFVSAGAVKSAVYTLKVVDLPTIKKIRVTYHFPAWSGLKDAVEDPGGDLRAVEGTVAEVAVQTDRPLVNGAVVLDDDKQIKLQQVSGNSLIAKVPIEKDGLYHFGVNDQGQVVRLSEDYFIEARKDTPPTVHITRPGRDAKVNPIAEVTLAADADDDFGLHALDLHYSVNGGEEKTVSLMSQKGAKHAEGKITVALEDYKLVPGDVLAVYATARDARNTTKTDISFIQAEPYEFEYSQAQSQGGAGQGEEENHISDRQKEIIAAIWNEMKGQQKNKTAQADDARFLAEVQGKLRDQSRTLAERMKARELSGTNQEFQAFTKDMEEAAKSMDDAVGKLRKAQWKDALVPAQKALPQLLRAEATFRQIQVAFGSRGGQGAGGSGRDLESLFDLELDTEKNQYETGQQSASSDQRQRQIDEALQKLKELAKRQEDLAQRQNQSQQNFQQRWEQEMLRREAEQLQKQMEQLMRGNSSQQQSGSQGQQSSQSQSQGQQQSSQSGASGQSASQQRLEEAFRRLSQATEDMRRASQSASQQSSQQAGQQTGQQGKQFGQQSDADARRAADRLKEAQDLLNGLQHQEAAQQLGEMGERADKLAEQERDFANRLRQQFGGESFDPRNPRSRIQPGTSREDANKMADEHMRQMNDLDKLERDLQQAVHDLAGTQPGVSSKLREALGTEQQSEVKLRMKLDSDNIRRGYGAYAWTAEQPVVQGLDQLRDGIKQAQGALSNGNPQQAGAGNDEMKKALARVEQLRQQLQQLQAGQQQRGQNQQNGQGRYGQDEMSQRLSRMAQQNGQPGQQSGQQSGQQQGQSGQQGQQGGQQPGQQAATGPYGGGGPHINPNGGDPGGRMEQTYREALRDLVQLRGSIGTSPDLARNVADLIQTIRQYDPDRIGDPNLLRDRLTRAVLPGLEELELEIRQKVGDEEAGQVRSSGSEAVPPGYADAVAEYFRKLSKTK